MANNDLATMAHLMRRAGFGATRDELEAYVAKGYEATVEDLVHPETQPDVEQDLMERYLPEYGGLAGIDSNQQAWVYRMISSKRPLQEKMTLFWHGILCTGHAKLDHGRMMSVNIDMYRQRGMGNYRDLLVELSRHPPMVYYLDNNENHKGSINENYGRELLELFSLGVGMDGKFNYTEDDVKAASHAFTGWNIEPTMPVFPYGRDIWRFRYDPADHDDGEKTFLGQTGRWNGEDIIDIIMRQPATARFICRHLYSFFVADEAQVPAWKDTPPRDMEAIRTLEKAFVESNYEIRPVLRTLFNSGLLQERPFCQDQEPIRSGDRHDEAGEGPHRSEAGPLSHNAGGHLHGAGPAQSAHGGGLAHGQGVDRQRQPGGADQLRCRPVGQPGAARGQADRGPDERREWGDVGGGVRGRLSGPHRSCGGEREDQGRVDRAREERW